RARRAVVRVAMVAALALTPVPGGGGPPRGAPAPRAAARAAGGEPRGVLGGRAVRALARGGARAAGHGCECERGDHRHADNGSPGAPGLEVVDHRYFLTSVRLRPVGDDSEVIDQCHHHISYR
ncbi:hypothetical protein, partial [Nocardia abscessus]|uniref:hypothetical protein n=1 Tax=Nocardia abscessus TaxID=120957 RepID=UPI00245590DB